MNQVITHSRMDQASQGITTDRKLRLAIIGCGPRGLQCLEALTRHLSSDALSRLAITVFEPAEKPGAGRVYDPAQSPVLKMNFATKNIDFWKSGPNTTPRSSSLLGWLDKHYPELARSDCFVPRAVVGEYLHACFLQVAAMLRRHCRVEWVRTGARQIRRRRSGWSVDDGQTEREFDEVVITTGHEGLRASPSLKSLPNEVFAFPADRNLTPDCIRPGSRVLVRGFGLTAIDAILMLSEGRGGSFESNSVIPRYRLPQCGLSTIDVCSRTGRPMLAKPTARVEPITDSFWTPFRERLAENLERHGALRWRQDIWTVVTEAAAGLLEQTDAIHRTATRPRAFGYASSQSIQQWFRDWSRYRMNASAARHVMLQSYAVALGRRPMDIPLALGEAWRKLYPELVNSVSHGGLAADQWPRFKRVSDEMERIAFGPPAESVGKILSLMKARVLRLRRIPPPESSYDVVVNAVIASPHQPLPDGPLSRLIRSQMIHTDETTGAIKVDAAGRPLGRRTKENGQVTFQSSQASPAVMPVVGIAIFGRATEGWVLGNDTLSRSLHNQIENWARGMAVVANA